MPYPAHSVKPEGRAASALPRPGPQVSRFCCCLTDLQGDMRRRDDSSNSPSFSSQPSAGPGFLLGLRGRRGLMCTILGLAQGPAMPRPVAHTPRSGVDSLAYREHRERTEWVNREHAGSRLSQHHRPTGDHDEQVLSWSQPGLCTPVDIRWKKAQKVSLCLTFGPARRDPDESGPDQQVLLSQVDWT